MATSRSERWICPLRLPQRSAYRRRTAREVLKREEVPMPVQGMEAEPADIPPSLDFESEVPPALADVPPPAFEAPIEHPAEDVLPLLGFRQTTLDLFHAVPFL